MCEKSTIQANQLPHKWAKEIKAWADGAKIEYRLVPNNCWFDVLEPNWGHTQMEYRVKIVKTYGDVGLYYYGMGWERVAEEIIKEFTRRNGLSRTYHCL